MICYERIPEKNKLRRVRLTGNQRRTWMNQVTDVEAITDTGTEPLSAADATLAEERRWIPVDRLLFEAGFPEYEIGIWSMMDDVATPDAAKNMAALLPVAIPRADAGSEAGQPNANG